MEYDTFIMNMWIFSKNSNMVNLVKFLDFDVYELMLIALSRLLAGGLLYGLSSWAAG